MEYVLDPEDMTLFGSSETNTAKLNNMNLNPAVDLYWTRQIRAGDVCSEQAPVLPSYFMSYGVQITGTYKPIRFAELIKEKSAKKTIDVHKKNLERIQKKASQIEAEKKKKERQRLERQERRRKNKEKYDAIRARVKAVKRAQKEMKKASKENSEAVIEDPVIQESSDTAVSSPDVEEVTTPNE